MKKVYVYLEDDIYDQCKEYAHYCEQSFSAWMRKIAKGELRRRRVYRQTSEKGATSDSEFKHINSPYGS